MNKGELVEIVHERIGGTKAAAEESVKATIEAISNALCEGDTVTLIGFGTFSITERQERTGRNPQTGATIKIAAKKAVKFSPGKTLKESVNEGKKSAKKKTTETDSKSRRKC